MEIENNYIAAGTPLNGAAQALIMIHGRGASAESILPLAAYLSLPEHTALLALQAPHHTWYPNSFIAPVETNQPALDEALAMVDALVSQVVEAGIPKANIYFLGFSQGACLALEYVTRNATRYAGVVAFTGGLIGEELLESNYEGDFKETPILISTSNPDHHVPLRRVKDSGCQLERMHAKITVVAHPGKPHNITDEEITLANKLIFTPKVALEQS